MKIKNIKAIAFIENLTKAYTEGIYSDTPANRKLGRVGMSYKEWTQKQQGGGQQQQPKEGKKDTQKKEGKNVKSKNNSNKIYVPNNKEVKEYIEKEGFKDLNNISHTFRKSIGKYKFDYEKKGKDHAFAINGEVMDKKEFFTKLAQIKENPSLKLYKESKLNSPVSIDKDYTPMPIINSTSDFLKYVDLKPRQGWKGQFIGSHTFGNGSKIEIIKDENGKYWFDLTKVNKDGPSFYKWSGNKTDNDNFAKKGYNEAAEYSNSLFSSVSFPKLNSLNDLTWENKEGDREGAHLGDIYITRDKDNRFTINLGGGLNHNNYVIDDEKMALGVINQKLAQLNQKNQNSFK